MLPSGKKFFKKIASRCESFEILDANKLYRKLDRMMPVLRCLLAHLSKWPSIKTKVLRARAREVPTRTVK